MNRGDRGWPGHWRTGLLNRLLQPASCRTSGKGGRRRAERLHALDQGCFASGVGARFRLSVFRPLLFLFGHPRALARVSHRLPVASLQTFDKQGFHPGTPPPFNLPSALGSTGPLNPGAAPGYAPAPFLHILPAHQQPHSQMLHHHLQQDGQVSGRAPAPRPSVSLTSTG